MLSFNLVVIIFDLEFEQELGWSGAAGFCCICYVVLYFHTSLWNFHVASDSVQFTVTPIVFLLDFDSVVTIPDSVTCNFGTSTSTSAADFLVRFARPLASDHSRTNTVVFHGFAGFHYLILQNCRSRQATLRLTGGVPNDMLSRIVEAVSRFSELPSPSSFLYPSISFTVTSKSSSSSSCHHLWGGRHAGQAYRSAAVSFLVRTPGRPPACPQNEYLGWFHRRRVAFQCRRFSGGGWFPNSSSLIPVLFCGCCKCRRWTSYFFIYLRRIPYIFLLYRPFGLILCCRTPTLSRRRGPTRTWLDNRRGGRPRQLGIGSVASRSDSSQVTARSPLFVLCAACLVIFWRHSSQVPLQFHGIDIPDDILTNSTSDFLQVRPVLLWSVAYKVCVNN